MDTEQYRFDGSKKYTAASVKPGDTSCLKDKAEGKQRLAANKLQIERLQDKLYADGSGALLVILQAMDAAGKDGTVKYVFGGVNPNGIRVSNFKAPTPAELAHDYLWRVHLATPPRGTIGVFNRSHYEDVLISRVLDLPKHQNYPRRTMKDIWARRYEEIRAFERHLFDNGVTVLKFHLHLSKEEQRQRFLERLEDPGKNWKFSQADLETRERWDDYQTAYREAINKTAAPHAPWYVVPADKKWYTRAVVSQVVADALKAMRPAYPKVDQTQLHELDACRRRLEAEQGLFSC